MNKTSSGNFLLMNVSSESETYGRLLSLSDGNLYYGDYSIQYKINSVI